MLKPGPPRKAALALAAAAVLAGALVLLTEGLYRLTLRYPANASREQGVFELYAMGESTMEGAPFYKDLRRVMPPPTIVSALFADRLSGRPLRVINQAFGGNSVYPQAVKMIAALKYRNKAEPAVLLIYAGHNEQIRLEQRPQIGLRLYEIFKQRVLIHSLFFSAAVLRLEQHFLFYGIRDLDHYGFYLRAVIEAAREAGVVPVLSTLAGNLTLEPWLEKAIPGLEEGLALELSGKYEKAAAHYARLAREQGQGPVPPYLEYRQGRCLQLLGKPALARNRLLYALENDQQPLRAKPSQNELLRALAREYSLPLVDAEKLFAERAPGGLPGKDLFVDHVHPGAAGYLLLSRAFAERLGPLCGDSIRKDIRDASALFPTPGMSPGEKAAPYLLAGTYMLWFSWSSIPIPDRLALAEKNFRLAAKLSGGSQLAGIGLRVTAISQKNGQTIPPRLYDWFRAKRPYFETLRPLPAAELAAAEEFLGEWEKAVPGRNAGRGPGYL